MSRERIEPLRWSLFLIGRTTPFTAGKQIHFCGFDLDDNNRKKQITILKSKDCLFNKACTPKKPLFLSRGQKGPSSTKQKWQDLLTH